MAAAAGTLFRLLLVTSMLFSHLVIFLNAVPVTRVGSLTHGARQVHQLSENSNLVTVEKRWEMNERIAVEINDYPGTGANNHHTPRPQFTRGCVDC